jgi:hypothetical protein
VRDGPGEPALVTTLVVDRFLPLLLQNVNQGDALPPLLFSFTLQYAIKKVQEI